MYVTDPTTSEGWIRSEKTWPIFWALIVAIPLLLLFFLGLEDYLGTFAAVGLWGTLEAIVAGVLVTAFAELFFLYTSGPVAIQIGSEGVMVRRTIGRPVRLPWSEVQISAARPPGFGLLRSRAPRGGFYPLSPNQFAKLRSSPQIRKEPSPSN